jgi:hypothetical protein
MIRNSDEILNLIDPNCSGIEKTVINFFVKFSRFEYCLKQKGCIRVRNNGEVQADWDKFWDEMIESEYFENLKKITSILEANPPKVLKINSNNLVWSDEPFQNPFQLLKRIRNNLFHGGKFLETTRNSALLITCIQLLDFCINKNKEISSIYNTF